MVRIITIQSKILYNLMQLKVDYTVVHVVVLRNTSPYIQQLRVLVHYRVYTTIHVRLSIVIRVLVQRSSVFHECRLARERRKEGKRGLGPGV